MPSTSLRFGSTVRPPSHKICTTGISISSWEIPLGESTAKRCTGKPWRAEDVRRIPSGEFHVHWRRGSSIADLLASLQFRIHHPDKPVRACPRAGRQESTRNFCIVGGRHLGGQDFLPGLALRNHLLHFCLHGEDHVAVGD